MAGFLISYGWILFHYLPVWTVWVNEGKNPLISDPAPLKWHSSSGCIHSQAQWKCRRVPFCPHQHLLSMAFEASHFNSPRWYLTVLLMGASPIIGDVEHLFLRLLIICTPPLEKCVLRSFTHFLNCYFFIILFLNCFPDSFIDTCMSSDISFSFFGVIILNYLSSTL